MAPPEAPPLKRKRRPHKDRPSWHDESCRGDCCWEIRPATPGEIRRMQKDNLRPFPDARSRWERRNIVAWDGEGYNDDNGDHIYNLLACSRGTDIINQRGLDTLDVFKFFVDNNTHSAINVIFGGSYDVNMILKDVDRGCLQELWATGSCRWRGWKISWTPRKKFSITPLRFKNGRFTSDYPHRFVLWDVFGYFQCSFVNACKQWGILDELELDAMQVMKFGRSSFTQEKLEDIRVYNQKEIEALVVLVRKLFDSMDEAGIRLERFDGAGSIASAYLRQHRVLDHAGDRENYMGVPSLSPVYESAQDAYSGGRVEAVYQGNYEGSIWRYDVNSAYPSAALDLPSFNKAEWKKELKWNGSPYSICYVNVHIRDEDAPFYPSFWRASVGVWKGAILYPRWAECAMYGYEYQNLVDFHEEGKDFRLMWAHNVYIHDYTKPFAWLESKYMTRLDFKLRGLLAELCIKLGMNSVYGKLAQQEGYMPHDRETRYPSSHHLLWAGLITSATRANLYRAGMEARDGVVAFATDAVFTTVPLHNLPINKQLGGWSCDRFDGITLAQAGVYWLKHTPECDCKECEQNPEDKWHSKYRGFDPGSLLRDTLLDVWSRGESKYSAQLTRFAGLGGSLTRTEGNFASTWRHWITEPRTLSLEPGGKRRIDPAADSCYTEKLIRTLPALNIEGGMSMAYPIKWIDGYTIRPNGPEGEDLRLLEDEWEDSYE